MRRSLALLALLLGIGSAEAREGFPYNQHLNLEYSVEGSFPISNSSSAVIQSDSNHAYGRADINILFGMVKKSMEFEVNFNDTCNTEDGNKINVPEEYIVNRWDFKIRDLIVTFKDCLPISAYSKTLYIPVLGEHKKVSAKLKE